MEKNMGAEKKENSQEVVKSKKDFKHYANKVPKHNWAISTYILGLLVLLLIVQVVSGNSVSGNAISETQMKVLVGDFVNTQLLQGLGEAEISDVKSESGVYVATVNFQEEMIPLYFTKDGNFISQGMPLVDIEDVPTTQTQTPTTQTPTTQTPQTSSYSQEDLEKIAEFSQCLAEKEFVVYGANWCGYTKQVADLFGGFGVISSDIYVECTENEALCSSEEIQGYPTIKIAGQPYQNARTLEAFAEATGCVAPELNVAAVSSSSDVQC
jgi:hypothetical protein